MNNGLACNATASRWKEQGKMLAFPGLLPLAGIGIVSIPRLTELIHPSSCRAQPTPQSMKERSKLRERCNMSWKLGLLRIAICHFQLNGKLTFEKESWITGHLWNNLLVWNANLCLSTFLIYVRFVGFDYFLQKCLLQIPFLFLSHCPQKLLKFVVKITSLAKHKNEEKAITISLVFVNICIGLQLKSPTHNVAQLRSFWPKVQGRLKRHLCDQTRNENLRIRHF